MFFLEYFEAEKRSAISVKFKIVLYGTFLNFTAWNNVLDMTEENRKISKPWLALLRINSVLLE